MLWLWRVLTRCWPGRGGGRTRPARWPRRVWRRAGRLAIARPFCVSPMYVPLIRRRAAAGPRSTWWPCGVGACGARHQEIDDDVEVETLKGAVSKAMDRLDRTQRRNSISIGTICRLGAPRGWRPSRSARWRPAWACPGVYSGRQPLFEAIAADDARPREVAASRMASSSRRAQSVWHFRTPCRGGRGSLDRHFARRPQARPERVRGRGLGHRGANAVRLHERHVEDALSRGFGSVRTCAVLVGGPLVRSAA
jgi:hypothetical protein